jgi:hypothetical protein
MGNARKKRIAEPAKLADGAYIAKPREKTLISAAANGHSSIWPEAKMVVSGNSATFYRGRQKVWACQAIYASTMFDVTPKQSDTQVSA